MINTTPSMHLLVCSALGVGHFTPTSNFVRLLCEQHPSEVYVTFFAPLRPGEGDKSPVLPAYTNLQTLKYVIEDATSVIMIDMKTKADSLIGEISKLLANAYQKGWPEVRVVIHDSFAWYAHEFVERSQPKLLEFLFNPSNSIAGEILNNETVFAHLLQGNSHYTFPHGQTLKVDIFPEMFFGPKEPLLDNEGSQSIFDYGQGSLTSDIAGLCEVQRTLYPDHPRKVYPLSPLCVWQDVKHDQNDQVCQWLDAQPERSVIYIALGSLYPMHREAIFHLASALERLEDIRFLWAIDENKITKDGPSVHEQWKKNTERRGLVVPWVHQPRVLAHRALRGFVSHCGWNSLVENAAFGGLPIVCLPLGSEQHVNSMIVEGLWKTGVCPLVRNGPPQIVGDAPPFDEGSPVMEQVFKSMPYMPRYQWPDVDGFCACFNQVFGSEYHDFALRAARLQVDCLKGIAPGGAVFKNLRRFIKDLRSMSVA